MTRSPTFQPVTGSASVTVAVALLGGGAELDPGAAQRRAVEVHAAAAADDGRARLLVHALDIVQADQGGVLRRRSARSGVPTSSAGRGLPGSSFGDVGVAVEAVLAGVVAGLDLDEADVEPRVPVARRSVSVPATWIERMTSSRLRRHR